MWTPLSLVPRRPHVYIHLHIYNHYSQHYILHPLLQPCPQAVEIRRGQRPKEESLVKIARACPVAHAHTENSVSGNNHIRPLTYIYHRTSLYTHHHGRC